MGISFEDALGVFPRALLLRGRRATVLASNLANVDTPNYKARDLPFEKVLEQVGNTNSSLQKTHPRHLAAGIRETDELLYRVPYQSSVDGNTVETHREHGEFAENALQYQAILRFLSGKFRGLKTAIRGE